MTDANDVLIRVADELMNVLNSTRKHYLAEISNRDMIIRTQTQSIDKLQEQLDIIDLASPCE